MTDFAIDIQFDRPDRQYHFGEPIIGTVLVTADRNYDVNWFGLYYQWRTHGRTGPAESEPEQILLRENIHWRTGKRYHYAFEIPISDGPHSYHGHNANCDWYLWPEFDSTPAQPTSIAAQEVMFYMFEAGESSAGEARGLPIRRLKADEKPYIRNGFLTVIGGAAVALVLLLILSESSFFVLFNDDIAGYALAAMSIGAIVGFAFWFRREGRRLNLYQWAERSLGPVSVTVTQGGGGQAITCHVSLVPLRDICIRTITTTLMVHERTTAWPRSLMITWTKLMFSTEDSQEISRQIETGEPFQVDTSVSLPPPDRRSISQTLPGRDSELIWQIDVQIRTARRFHWKRTYLLEIE